MSDLVLFVNVAELARSPQGHEDGKWSPCDPL